MDDSTEEHLDEREIHSALFELYPDATLLIDADSGLPVRFNRIAHEQLGYTAEEFATLHIADYEALETPEEIAAHIRTIFEQGQDDFETQHRCKDGRIIDVRVSVVLLPARERTLLLAVFRNISEQKQALRDLGQSEQRFRDVAQAAGEYIWEIDAQGVYLFVTSPAEPLLGYPVNEIIGRSPFEFMPDEEAERVRNLLTDYAQNKSSWRDLEHISIRSDGQVVHQRVSGLPILNEYGELTGFRGTGRDITAEKEAEKTRQALTDRLALATSAAELGIWDYDLTSGHLEWDEGMLRLYGIQPSDFGYSFEDWTDALLPESREAAIAAFQTAVCSEQPFDTRLTIRRASDGAIRTLHGQARIIRDSTGSAVRVVGVNRDITNEEESRQRLAAAEAKFRTLFELSPVGIAMNDYATGAFLDFNNAIIEPTGYTREEFLQLDYWRVTPKAYMAEEQAQLESLERTGRYGPFRKEYIRKDGSRYPVLLYGFKTTTPEGREVIWSIIQDLSSIERTRQELESTRNQLTSLAAQLPGFVYQYRIWPDGHSAFVYASQGIREIYGTTPDQVADSATPVFDIICDKDRSGIAHSIEQSAQTLTPWHEIYRVNHPTKGLIWVEGHATPEPLDDGGTLWHGYIHDVTERTQAERELADNKARLDAFFAQSVSGFFFMMLDEPIDWNGANEEEKEALLDYVMAHQRMTKVNRAMLDQYGAEEQDLLGLTGNDLFAHDLKHGRQIWRDLLDRGRAHVETHEQRVDGKPIIIDGDYICLYDEQGRLTGHFGVQNDVTERKQQQEALELARTEAERASRSKSEFLANMSHEIRTPMNAVIGLSQLLAQTRLDERQRDQVRKIYQSSRMLLGILNDVLDFSKIEAGRLELESREFKLHEVVEQMATLFGEKAHFKGLELLYDIPPNLPRTLIGDSLRLAQVLGNLLSNAIKFTGNGGTVEFGIREIAPPADTHVDTHGDDRSNERATLRFHIRDTGIGMSEEQLARLFRPFSQADTSTTRQYGGTGLGLVISRRLVEKMGGRLDVETTLGKGSTFSFTLLLPLGPNHGEAITCPDTQGRRVLIVDDQASARQITRELLHHCHYITEEAASGETAIERIIAAERRGEPFDFILLDWMMPGGMDGGETCEAIERLHRSGELTQTRSPILMVSAYAREELDMPESLITGYLAKPLTASALYDALVHAEGGSTVDRSLPAVQVPDLSGQRLLLVEDNAINQEVAQLLLEQTGATLRLAANGVEAIEAVRAESPGLILMDLQMPVMDGFEATRTLRAEGYGGPIIALSAAVMDDDRRRAFEAGVDAHLGKPIESEELYATLAAHLTVTDSATTGATVAAEPTEKPAAATLPAKLAGFDLTRGRRQLSGDNAVYTRLLRRFRDSLESDYAPLVEHLRAGRDEEARRIAHSLKGVAGTLAATTLQQLAEKIDAALKRDQPVTADTIDALEHALAEAHQTLSTFVPDEEEADEGEAADQGGSLEAVETLRRQLEASEWIEDSTLRAAIGYLRSRNLESDLLRAQVERMDFDQALQSLEQLLQDGNQNSHSQDN
ncbi:PAS domain S-box protein [Halorhodospira abdelmalekii]|uniref:PAS domain S-box protein n=1 Tax=Halorhodospira abdelmalekii TaxID=421629 RepID=UPI001902D56D